ncbi:urease subunit alpha [Methylorubrum extorquens]|uniref:urease subunit alpha n=1 Tax=Methylorubrum extorquens TaxID=408 RepID=UPI000972803E|nr:urease subunit alpha [Methylorubrum extorquens]APX83460.1 urease subunit alpha [Methylorubrum extorquens]MCG5249342.1 urease subunit alpha [Methylorubrum extorquens]
MSKISRRQYSDLYGPTTGDKIRLADTDLYIEIEKDLRVYGEEAVYGGGKTLRDGMGYDNELTSAAGAPDLVITNVTILDAVQGVIKADLGIKNGLIVGIGKAGNPSTMSGVTRGLALGPGTDAISGEHLILTAGGIDAHVHFISPQQAQAALSNGVTTLFGGGIGPSDGTNGTTITPGTWNIEMMLRSFDAWPVNAGVHGKGNCSALLPIEEQIRAGAMGLKVHEDWGSTPAAIRMALTAADDHDVQVCIHTDTLNEAGFVESTIAAFEGRTIHTYHTEGAGGGHAPDIIRVAGISNVIPSSTNPTMPYGINSQAELFDMVMVCHNLSPKIPTDVAFAESRVRAETIAAENVLHDLGAISILSSDSQAMGRVGENWARTIQTAHLMKARLGAYPGDASGNDNQRVLRFVAKVTINPAIVAGVSHVIGSVEVGKMADLVLWEPAFFGAKPKIIIKGGMISWAIMGDPNASLPTPQPVVYRPMFGALGPAVAKTRVTFTSHAAYEDGIVDRYELTSKVVPVYGTRTITKASMVRNDRLPVIEVNPETFAVMVDGKHATIEPATHLPLAQLHFFS